MFREDFGGPLGVQIIYWVALGFIIFGLRMARQNRKHAQQASDVALENGEPQRWYDHQPPTSR